MAPSVGETSLFTTVCARLSVGGQPEVSLGHGGRDEDRLDDQQLHAGLCVALLHHNDQFTKPMFTG